MATLLNNVNVKLEDAGKRLQAQSADLQQYAGSTQRQTFQLDELKQRLESVQGKVQDFFRSGETGGELSVKNDLIERLMAEKQRHDAERGIYESGAPERHTCISVFI